MVCVPSGPLRSYDFDGNIALLFKVYDLGENKGEEASYTLSFAKQHDDFEHPVKYDGQVSSRHA